MNYQVNNINGQNTGTNSAPIVQNTETASGSITTQNLVPGGIATVGSSVGIALSGLPTLSIQTTGTYTGALSVQLTVDEVNWITVGGTSILNVNGSTFLPFITSALQGVFQIEVSGFTRARVTGLGAMTGTAVVTLRATQATPTSVSIKSPLPSLSAGSNNIGVVKTFALADSDWSFAPAAPAITVADVVLKAAGAAGIRNYVTGVQMVNSSATVATEIVIKDGLTVIWRGFAAIGAILNIVFPSPLRGTAATALNFACITTGANVYVNAQGYSGV